MTTARRLKPKIWRAADAGQRRDLGSTVTGRSTIYMYHRLTTYAFLRGLILLLRRPTGHGSSSSSLESDSHSRRYPGLFEFLHFEMFCQVAPPVRLAHRRCRSGASAPKGVRYIVFTVRSTLSVPFSIAVSPHLPLRRHAGSGFTPRTHRDDTFRASCLLYRWPPNTSVSNMVIPLNLPHMELQQQTEVWQTIGRPLWYPLARAYVSPPPRSTTGSEQRSLTQRQVGTQHISQTFALH